MALVPENKQWLQRNDGDSLGNIYMSWGIDLDSNKGSLKVSNSLLNVFDETDDGDFDGYAGQFVEFDDKLWAISDRLFETTNFTNSDITDTSNWSQDSEGSSPSPQNTDTDAVVFDGKLIVQDGGDLEAFDGSSWDDEWWTTTLGESALDTSEIFILKVLGNFLYVTDGGNKVHSVDVDGNVSIAGTDTGTLDFSATPHVFTCATTTSSRIFYGTEDTASDDAYIIEWDGAEESLTPNRIHKVGAKRVLNLVTWNDTPIAVLSDGRIVYFNGSAFVDWPNARFPVLETQLEQEAMHKNGSAIIDGLPHFLINPNPETFGFTFEEINNTDWNFPAGIYCLDPERGLYLRYTLGNDGDKQFVVRETGALFGVSHPKTKFLASYIVYTGNGASDTLPIIAAENKTRTLDSQALLGLIPFESVQEVVKQVTLVHKKLGTGDEINLYYARSNPEQVRVTGNWESGNTFNTTESIGNLAQGWVGMVKSGANGYFFSTVESVDSSVSTNSITFADDSGATLNDVSSIQFLNFKYMGTVQAGQEIQDFNIPEPKRSRQIWVLLEIKQAAGNDVQLDYLLTQ